MPASSSAFLNVRDFEKALEFYQGLGFKVTGRYERRGMPTYADLELDGAELGLGNIRSNDDPAFRAWVGTPLGAGVVVYVTVPDVDAVWVRAKAMRATIEAPLEARSYGRVFTVNDPDGYTITFLEPPRGARRADVPAKAATRPRAGPKKTQAGGKRKPGAKAAARRAPRPRGR